MQKNPIRASLQGLMIAAGLFGITTGQAASPIATYDITITNLTMGQPLTPPVVATHRSPVHAFEVGTPASFEVKEIAENGNVVPLADAFDKNKHVWDSMVVPSPSGPPPILPDATLSFEISASRSAKYLSFVSMLICTNDGFTGLDSLRLPRDVGEIVTVSTQAYDAGTEMNTEDFADIVPPCQALVEGVMSDDPGTGMSNPALTEGGVITMHTGIVGGNDLEPFPGIHGWTGPVAEVTITRTE